MDCVLARCPLGAANVIAVPSSDRAAPDVAPTRNIKATGAATGAPTTSGRMNMTSPFVVITTPSTLVRVRAWTSTPASAGNTTVPMPNAASTNAAPVAS